MPIDDELGALERQFEFEDATSIPFAEQITEGTSALLSVLSLGGPKAQIFLGQIKKRLEANKQHRSKVFFETVVQVMKRLTRTVDVLQDNQRDTERKLDLLADGLDKATATRSEARIKRIATILAHGLIGVKDGEEDEIDEMMRIAMELTDRDVDYLGSLVGMEGGIVKTLGRVNRYEAFQRWEASEFKQKNDPEVEGCFSKLESYGLVWRLPSQNNMNVMADIMNGYGLLPKGLRFTELIQSAQTKPAS